MRSRFTAAIQDSRFTIHDLAECCWDYITSNVSAHQHYGSMSRRNLSATSRESLIVISKSSNHDSRFTIYDSRAWRMLVGSTWSKRASKPARPRYTGGTLTDFVAIISVSSCELRLCGEYCVSSPPSRSEREKHRENLNDSRFPTHDLRRMPMELPPC